MKFLELAHKVLSETKRPMTATEIWDHAETSNYIKDLDTLGKTPKATLGARLYMAVLDKANANFASVGNRPKKFYIPSITPEVSIKESEQVLQTEEESPADHYLEKDLHCVLAYVARTQFSAYCKTIPHQKSRKKEFGEWLHPDMVGCSFPQEHWKTDAHELSKVLGDVQLRLYSFELKQRLSFGNLRESFFQAVSNSSWAHEGYLVAADISQELDFMQELHRLSSSFGIGVILLDLEHPDNSEVLMSAKDNEFIDWDTVNKLADRNDEFSEFITRVRKDVESKEVREEWYDEFLDSEVIRKKFKGRLK